MKFLEIFRMVVGTPDLVALTMGQLPFDHVRRKAILIENC